VICIHAAGGAVRQAGATPEAVCDFPLVIRYDGVPGLEILPDYAENGGYNVCFNTRRILNAGQFLDMTMWARDEAGIGTHGQCSLICKSNILYNVLIFAAITTHVV